jgi:hypothetical protein
MVEKQAVTIAYLIRAHFLPAQLGRLVDRLDSEQAAFFIHVSAQTSVGTYAKMREAVGERANVQWLERVPTYYAGFSLLQPILIGLRAIAATETTSHTVILSGQDYPTRPASEIETFLHQRPGESFVKHFALPAMNEWPDEHGGLDRIQHWYFERLNYRTRLLRLPILRRRFPPGLQPYGGGSLCALSHDAVRYISSFVEEKPEVVRFFRHVKMPDEIFVPTVLLNSPFRDSVVGQEVHYVDWSRGGAHPKTLGVEDYDRIIESGKLFARKFDVRSDAEVLDMLDANL